jgi:hypothetical protein
MLGLALATVLALAGGPSTGCVRLGAGADTQYYPASDHEILVSAGLRAYRITTTPSALLADRSATIVVKFVNDGVVCSPMDMSLEVVSASGRSGLIIQSITPLSKKAAERLRKGGPSYKHLGI